MKNKFAKQGVLFLYRGGRKREYLRMIFTEENLRLRQKE